MRACKLRGVQRGVFRPQTTQSADRIPAPNLLLRRKAASVPGRVWVADITFIPTKEGWLYLAGVMDQGSRRILGMAFDSRLDASLCLAALRQAFGAQPQQRQRLIHHSDQGHQYASSSYRQLLRQKQIHQSMSRRANCYDNAHMESFWATLKTEALPRQSCATRAEARLTLFDYVHTFYNRVRLPQRPRLQITCGLRTTNQLDQMPGFPNPCPLNRDNSILFGNALAVRNSVSLDIGNEEREQRRH
jgi:transposase InsO family protein